MIPQNRKQRRMTVDELRNRTHLGLAERKIARPALLRFRAPVVRPVPIPVETAALHGNPLVAVPAVNAPLGKGAEKRAWRVLGAADQQPGIFGINGKTAVRMDLSHGQNESVTVEILLVQGVCHAVAAVSSAPAAPRCLDHEFSAIRVEPRDDVERNTFQQIRCRSLPGGEFLRGIQSRVRAGQFRGVDIAMNEVRGLGLRRAGFRICHRHKVNRASLARCPDAAQRHKTRA
jgi:hypothetical protein